MRPLPAGLIVSCQAEAGSPFCAPEFIVAFARAAELGGAVGLRVCGVENVAAVRAVTSLPIIGLTKNRYPDGEVLITAGLAEARALAAAGADVIALDATHRRRPGGDDALRLLGQVREVTGRPVLADIATLAEGLAAHAADWIGTTLSGYTPETKGHGEEPDFALVGALARELPGKVVAEGRIWSPEQARRMFELGAHAVVVGTAITRPTEITRRFAAACARGPRSAAH